MADVPTCDWPGRSGQSYRHYVYALPHSFDQGQSGNYIFCRLDRGAWVPIYIGEGDLADRVNTNTHHKGGCILQKGATHFHCHTKPQQASRLAEEQDLLANWSQAYVNGCNERPGG